MSWWPLLLLVVVLGAVACTIVLAYVRSRAQHWAVRMPDGTQEIVVVVEGRYVPSRVDLEAGVPTTLRFDRREDDPCSEMLVSELWPSAHRLAPNAQTLVRFTPQLAGRFPFTCQMGMYTGELIVHERSVA